EVCSAFFIHLSTDFIFDGKNGPYTEDDLPNPLSTYGESKLKSERILQKSGLKHAVIRTVLVYGIVKDMSRSNIILWVKKSLEEKKNIRVVNDQWRTPTLAEDLAKGCALIAEKELEGVFNISGRDLLTPYDIAIATADFFDLDKSLIEEVDGSIFTEPAKRPAKTGFILDKAKRELGYEPVSFNEGLSILNHQLANV
ncbi:MAG: sugar nucleotide-binding protein, partial [Ekhidna sp.]|nr:sugar nucleotide-binding protein [Ekhidna sp.]